VHTVLAAPTLTLVTNLFAQALQSCVVDSDSQRCMTAKEEVIKKFVVDEAESRTEAVGCATCSFVRRSCGVTHACRDCACHVDVLDEDRAALAEDAKVAK
jgi:hypothetical protein